VVSSKGLAEAKNLSARLRQTFKKWVEDFYANAEESGHYPWPHEAMSAFGRILERAAEGEWAPQPPDHPGVSAEAFEALLSPRFIQQTYQIACDAHVRHMPGREITKRGRKPNVELAERIWTLHDAGKTSPEIRKALATGGVNLTLEAVEAYLKTRRRKPQQ